MATERSEKTVTRTAESGTATTISAASTGTGRRSDGNALTLSRSTTATS